MTDRESFLAAILAQPDDDVARLVYADWLDENADCDRDRAIAEFIRLSCVRSKKRRMPEAAYPWLYDVEFVTNGRAVEQRVTANWARLVPALLAEHVARWPQDDMAFRRVGRNIRLTINVILPRSNRTFAACVTPCLVNLWFGRGFLESVRIEKFAVLMKLAPVIRADQPLCRFIGTHADLAPVIPEALRA